MNRLKLPKLTNTRDLGGMQTADGSKIREGKLIRSGKLSKLPKTTVRHFQKLGVSLVIDLRIESERVSAPDTILEGCQYVHLPLLWFPTYGVVGSEHLFTATDKSFSIARKEGARIKREFGNTDNYMIEIYRSMVFGSSANEMLSKFLRLVIDNDGCVLWHCASGKDRAGVCAMIIEGLLGVDEQTILSDYMISAKYWKRRYFFNKLGLCIAPIKHRIKRVLFGLMRTKEQYLKTIMDEIKERFGSIVQYCKSVLGISDNDISILKQKYLITA